MEKIQELLEKLKDDVNAIKILVEQLQRYYEEDIEEETANDN